MDRLRSSKGCHYLQYFCIYCRRSRTFKSLQIISVVLNLLLIQKSLRISELIRKIQMHDLNVCCNSVFRTIFHFNKLENVKSFSCGLGRLNCTHFVKLFRLKVVFHSLQSDNRLPCDFCLMCDI